jgi:putative DNA primase/helicase
VSNSIPVSQLIALRDRGFSDDEIAKMTSAEARQHLGLANGQQFKVESTKSEIEVAQRRAADAGQHGVGEQSGEDADGADGAAEQPAPAKYTHVRWSPMGEPNLECTPTDAEEARDGKVFVEVHIDCRADPTWVLKDELITVEEAKRRLSVEAQSTPQPQNIVLSAGEVAKFDTWLVELATEIHGAGRQEDSGNWRFGDSGSIVIFRTAYWHSFSAGEGGYGALSFLEQQYGDRHAAANAAHVWLAQHPGNGLFGRDPNDDEDVLEEELADAEATAYVRGLVSRVVKVTESEQAMRYYADRGLDPVAVGADAQLGWLPDWRGDEGVIVHNITDNAGETVAVQLLHIGADGQKSPHQPVRKILRGPHDWRKRGAFRLGDLRAAHLVQVEGAEAGIAARMSGGELVHACLGISALGRDELPMAVNRVTVAGDTDLPGSPASLALGRGIARLLLQGRAVDVAPPAPAMSAEAKDAKDIADLVQLDIELARRQLRDAIDSGLKWLSDVERNALLDEASMGSNDAYERHHKVIAAALGWRGRALDDDRNRRRQERAKQGDDPVTRLPHIEPWPDAVMDIGAVLDAAVVQLRRFLVAPDLYLYTIALWAGHSHLVHKKELEIGFTPRIAFQSPIRRCGKSTALKCTHLMSHNPRTAASISPSSLFRAVDAFEISLMVDEGDNVFKSANPDLLAIMNSGADKMTATIMRTEKNENGKFEPREFNCFAPIGFTSIKQLPETLQDRSIVLPMKRATKDERPGRLTMRTRGPLIDIGRQMARWAAGLLALAEPDVPADLFNRIEDRWFVLFQIARAAGGEWPARCRAAALADLAREEINDADGGREGDLLADVWQVFREKGVVQMFTKDICNALLAMDESPWTTANHGQRVNEYYLRAHLKDFIPDNAEKIAPRKWKEGHAQARGFHQLHFEDAFGRYLGKGLPCPPADRQKPADIPPGRPPKGPSHPSTDGDGTANSNGYTWTCNADPSVYHPSTAGEAGEVGSDADLDTGRVDGSGTDAQQPFATNNADTSQFVTGKWMDGADETDPRQNSANNTPSEGLNRENQKDSDGPLADAKPNGAGGADALANGPDGANGEATSNVAAGDAMPNGPGAQYPRAWRGRGRGRKPNTPREDADQ